MTEKHRCTECGFLHSRRGPDPVRAKVTLESNKRGIAIRTRAAERKRRVPFLRKAGKTFREIGEILGMSHAHAAELYKRHLRKQPGQ